MAVVNRLNVNHDIIEQEKLKFDSIKLKDKKKKLNEISSSITRLMRVKNKSQDISSINDSFRGNVNVLLSNSKKDLQLQILIA